MNFKKYSPGFVIISILFLFGPTCFGQKKDVVDSLKKELLNTVPDTNRVKILNEIGGYLLKIGNYDQAKPYLMASKDLAEELSYLDGLATALNRIAILYMDKNAYDVSTKYYMEALEIRKKTGDLKGIADIVSNMGIIYSAQAEYAKALNCYLISLRIREVIHDAYGIGTSMNLIANIYFLQRKYTEALKYYYQTLSIDEVENDPYFKGLIISNIGITYVNLENYLEALKCFKTALAIDEEIGDKEGIANSYSNIGEVCAKNGNFKEAVDYYQKGLQIFEEIGYKKGISESYACLGRMYDTLGQSEKALEYYNLQLRIATEIRSKVNMSKAHLSIADHYKKLNDYKKAYESYQVYKQLEDEIHSEAIAEEMNEMEIKYNTQKKEIEIETLKNEKYQKEIEYNKQQQINYGFILLLIIASLLFFLWFNRRRIKKKQILERKNFEIQLKALSEQMNPHFIFNSLNSIMEFIRTSEKEAALKYLTKFSRLIRLVLESSGKKSVSLSNEIELLKLYMELENLRFGGVFTYEIIIDEKLDIHSLEIPPLIIQPFIENSILHGIQNKQKSLPPKTYQGKIELVMKYENDFLSCTITDNGIGRKKAMEIKTEKLFNHQSLGMRITKDRLNMLSQNQCTATFTDLVDENNQALGTQVKILIPLIDPFQ
jgi:tetratricopeptide (TPR) repeat protein